MTSTILLEMFIKRKQGDVNEKGKAVEAIRHKEDQKTRAQKVADHAAKMVAGAEASVETASRDTEKKVREAREAAEALATVSEDDAR